MRRLTILALVSILGPISACDSGGQAPKEPSADQQIRAVIHQTIDAWNRGDADAYASTYCAKKRERRLGELTSSAGVPKKVEDVSIGRVTINGGVADAEVTLKNNGRKADTETFPMVLENGRWKTCD
ncbi:hypothetical protein FK535_06930 [Mycolicibacterium sp. 018/SC-01/001]|uniref:Rv0361 family membrane protein n=1 Tax=Mycolicibacterium sp. 018/SC-01/001 TaxID=2592069 RepID=UPI00117FCDE9|nr:hypothetical protein [Mycolicibacterium sp. 018/SC-01/001]TRW86201.1 hypothetical protein FK535_06930 [Mycolicibacterium sp. 018/SC-01/001]